MAYTPLSLALSQPTGSSGGSSKWARILGAGLTGASFLPQLGGNSSIKNAMLTGGLGMLGSGSYAGGLAALPSLLAGFAGSKGQQTPSVPLDQGPGGTPMMSPPTFGQGGRLPAASLNPPPMAAKGPSTAVGPTNLGGGSLPTTSSVQQQAIQRAMNPGLPGRGVGPLPSGPAALPGLPNPSVPDQAAIQDWLKKKYGSVPFPGGPAAFTPAYGGMARR